MGWYRDEAFNTGYSFTTMPAESPTLYAKWIVEFKQINASGNISSALSANGNSYFWGDNSMGQLGFNSYIDFLLPNQLTSTFLNPNELIRDIETDYYSSFLITDQNRVFAFGYNLAGKLGTTVQLNQQGVAPTEITFSGLNPGEFISSISGSYRNSFAITNFSNIYAWGTNRSGQLGLGHQDDIYTPTKLNLSWLNNAETIISVKAGGNYSVFLTSEGRILTFGTNVDGQLGNGQRTTSITNLPTFIQLPSLNANEKVIQIEASSTDHVFALTNQNRLIGWGSNTANQLGLDDPPSHILNPTIIFDSTSFGLSISETIIKISSSDGMYFTFILTSEGRVFAWGNSNSSYGLPLSKNPKVFNFSNLQNSEKITSIYAGRTHVMALTNLGRIFTIGDNSDGQLGTGNQSNRSSFSYIEIR
jgi:alpha-tubulin suppressor-like RCC1 family protein